MELGVNTKIIRGGVLEARMGHELKKGMYRRAYLFKSYNVSIWKITLCIHKYSYNYICVCVCFWQQPHSDVSDGTELMLSFDSTDFLIGLGKFSELFQMRCQEHV